MVFAHQVRAELDPFEELRLVHAIAFRMMRVIHEPAPKSVDLTLRQWIVLDDTPLEGVPLSVLLGELKSGLLEILPRPLILGKRLPGLLEDLLVDVNDTNGRD